MTVKEAIAQADELRLNTMSDAQKVECLRELDGELMEMFQRDYEPTMEIDPSKFPVTNTYPEENQTLFVPFPYDRLYVYHLCAQIDLYNTEEARYMNDMSLYNAAIDEAMAWWRRNHRPKHNRNWRVM